MGNKVVHAVELLAGSAQENQDRIRHYIGTNIAHAAGGSAGASVATTVTLPEAIPAASYNVQATADQDATTFVTKSAGSFVVTLTPRLPANTLALGTFDVLVTA